jgi:hypothetical protein
VSATPGRKLADWIGEMLARGDAGGDTGGRLVKLVCCHIVKGNKLGDELRMVAVPAEPDEDWIAVAAQKITDQAGEEARTLGSGIQRYAVQAYFEGGEKPHGRHVFTMAGADELGSVGTEGPDAEGLTAQAMRHAEFYAQLNARAQVQQMADLQQEITGLRRENSELRADRVRNFKVMEEVYSLRAEREIATERERAKAKLFSDGAEKLGLLFPMALNHMAGKKIFPESATQVLMLKSLVESIDKATFDKLAGVLSGEQMALFFQLATSVAKPAEPAPAAESNGITTTAGQTS